MAPDPKSIRDQEGNYVHSLYAGREYRLTSDSMIYTYNNTVYWQYDGDDWFVGFGTERGGDVVYPVGSTFTVPSQDLYIVTTPAIEVPDDAVLTYAGAKALWERMKEYVDAAVNK